MRVLGNEIHLEDSSGNTAAVVSVEYSNMIRIRPVGAGRTLEIGTDNYKWETIRLNARTVEFPQSQQSVSLGKCSLCQSDAFIKRAELQFCDICYFAFARTPALDRLLENWTPKDA